MDSADKLIADGRVNDLHCKLVRSGGDSLPEDVFWACADEMAPTTVSNLVQIKGKLNRFQDADADKPEMDTLDDKFSNHLRLIYYLPAEFRDQVFVRHPAIYRLYKQNVPLQFSDVQFWTGYCRWKFHIPIIPGNVEHEKLSGIFDAYKENPDELDMAMSLEELQTMVSPENNLQLLHEQLPYGYGGLNIAALEEGATNKLKCEKKDFRPYQILGDVRRENVVKQINRHGSIVAEGPLKLSEECTNAYQDQYEDGGNIRTVAVQSLEGHQAGERMQSLGNSIFRAKRDAPGQRVNLDNWNPSHLSGPTDGCACDAIQAAVAPRQKHNAGMTKEICGSKRKMIESEYGSIVQLLTWFWRLCPAWGEAPAKRRKCILKSIENHHRCLKEQMDSHSGAQNEDVVEQNVMINLQRVVALAKGANVCIN